jgi:ABC-type multidrug transport system ATPase subunit
MQNSTRFGVIVKDLSVTYPGGVRALAGLDLEIGQGLFGLLGPNGAGKNTLPTISPASLVWTRSG